MRTDCYVAKKCTDKNCINCVNNQCVECKPGYSIYGNDGLCQLCDNSCMRCNGSNNNQCTECNDDYYNPNQADGSQSFSCTNLN